MDQFTITVGISPVNAMITGCFLINSQKLLSRFLRKGKKEGGERVAPDCPSKRDDRAKSSWESDDRFSA